MNDHVRTDQTLFAAQEPYLDPTRPTTGTPTSNPKQRQIMYVVAGIAVFLIIVIVMGMMLSQTEAPMNLMESSPSPKAQVTGKYAEELKLLNDDLEKTDPTQKELPFPPINPEISL